MHPYWFFIFKHITDLGVNLTIETNGLLLNERNLQYLRTIKPHNTAISFESGRTLHTAIRGKDAYEKALKGLKNLVKNKLKSSVRLTYTKGADVEIEQFFADIAETGTKNIKIYLIKNAGRAKNNPDLLCPPPDFTTAMKLLGLGKKYDLKIQFSETDFPNSLNDNTPTPHLTDTTKNSGAGFDTCYISPYGQVFSCITMPTRAFGELHDVSFTNVWQGEKANDFRKDRLNHAGNR
jgi:MoaA/NifB/PqqE/SkfB family radical SAM enzyme